MIRTEPGLNDQHDVITKAWKQLASMGIVYREGILMGNAKRSTPTHETPMKLNRAEARPSPKKHGLVDEEAAEEARLDDLKSRLVERPDGFYWQEELSTKLYGPFPTLMEALQDMQYREDSDYEEGETLQEAEAEIGISDWVDPETGLPAEGLTPHRGGD